MFKEITKDNWLLFAQQNYDNPTLEKEEEFYDDIKRFKYLKRLFRKYEITGDIKIRLILNHLIVLQNVFGPEPVKVLLFYKINQEYWSLLKTFLVFLSYMNDTEIPQITIDKKLMEKLKGI